MKTLLAAAVVSVVLSGSAHAATVFSDDFEGYGEGAPISSLSPNWTVTGGTVDVIPVGSSFVWYGPGHYLDLNGTPDGAGTIESSGFATVAGQEYKLTFDYGKNKNSNALAKTLEFGVVGGLSSTIMLAAVEIVDFMDGVFSFFGTGSVMQIFFADISPDTNDAGGPIIDNVNVAAVPLPAGGLLLGGAMAGLAAFAGWRRKQKIA
jgi:hypothetical protein